MSILLDPTLKRDTSRYYVAIECASDLTRGSMTVVDRFNRSADQRNAAIWSETLRTSQPTEVCWTLSVQGWKSALLTALQPTSLLPENLSAPSVRSA